MGNPFLLQACLRLDQKEIPKQLEIGKRYKLSKQEHRLYQIKVPMTLVTNDWKALGRCVVTKYTIGEGKTEGEYVIVQIFDKVQAEQVTKIYVSDEAVEGILKTVK